MNKAYLHLGSNVGNRDKNLEVSIYKIEQTIGHVLLRSKTIETKAWGNTDQADFLNKAILVETTLSPRELLIGILDIESDMGRTRSEKWEPRIIDIDIIFFNLEVINETNLKIPHPLMQEREFVLKPLIEIAADYVHPILNKSVKELVNILKNQNEISHFAFE